MRNLLRAALCGLGFVFLSVALFPAAGHATPDPCLIVYPEGPCEYHYESSEYYTVGPGDSLYDPMYDRGGEVLIDAITHEIAWEVYQAPGLTGFVLDEDNQGYYAIGTDFNLIVDGFSDEPTTYVNILLVFDQFEPEWCVPNIWVDGNPILYDAGLGWYYPIGDLVVSTPTEHGNNYSDQVTHHIVWEICYGVRIYAFSDENYNLHRDGNECKTAFSHDTTVPTKESSWGAIKAIYSE
ncbi:MAG: hypothetical protein JSW58_10925 [Candidatus Latescibacterota bacterium]|nr:MAG: hypothetical protein JSW58_10925 [Candidatus Latescibacterota bacterium]